MVVVESDAIRVEVAEIETLAIGTPIDGTLLFALDTASSESVGDVPGRRYVCRRITYDPVPTVLTEPQAPAMLFSFPGNS